MNSVRTPSRIQSAISPPWQMFWALHYQGHDCWTRSSGRGFYVASQPQYTSQCDFDHAPLHCPLHRKANYKANSVIEHQIHRCVVTEQWLKNIVYSWFTTVLTPNLIVGFWVVKKAANETTNSLHTRAYSLRTNKKHSTDSTQYRSLTEFAILTFSSSFGFL